MSNIKPHNFFRSVLFSSKFAQKLLTPSLSRTATPTSPSSPTLPNDYKRSTAPTALPIHKILTTKLFPLSIPESFHDFKTRHDLDVAQENLLKTLPFYNDADDARHCEVIKVKLDDSNDNYINEFIIMPKDADYSKLNHFVLVHGYGAGLGFYLKNFDELSFNNKNWCIHSIDLLGYGCSSRPKYDPKKTVEEWFIDSIEKWRSKRNIDKMLLCSHSLGAYMSILYTKKYPGIVKKLMLISPAGIAMPKIKPSSPKWFNYLWEANVSPFSLVRNSGPFGSLITSGWTSRRFAKLTQREKINLHKYTYCIFNAFGSGEYFMSQILGVGGIPKNPMVDKIDELIKCDSVWCYGDEDWMPKEGGLQSCEKIEKNTEYETDFKIIKNSGHHIYLDNYKDFNQLCLDEMKNYEKRYT